MAIRNVPASEEKSTMCMHTARIQPTIKPNSTESCFQAENAFNHATDEHCAHNRAVPVLRTDKAENRHKGKADAHDDGQTGADLAKSLLFAELNRTVCSVHALNNCERFQLIAKITNDAAALLEALLDGDADAFHGTACLCNDGQQTL